MKLTIDTTAKTIELCENISFEELQKELKKMLPNDWKEYKLLSTQLSTTWVYNGFNIAPTISLSYTPYSEQNPILWNNLNTNTSN